MAPVEDDTLGYWKVNLVRPHHSIITGRRRGSSCSSKRLAVVHLLILFNCKA
jgi:hypothetical protein